MASSSASEGEALTSVDRYAAGRLTRGGRFVFESERLLSSARILGELRIADFEPQDGPNCAAWRW